MHEVGITIISTFNNIRENTLTNRDASCEDALRMLEDIPRMPEDSKQIKNIGKSRKTRIGPGASVSRKSFFRSPCALRNFSGGIFFIFLWHAPCMVIAGAIGTILAPMMSSRYTRFTYMSHGGYNTAPGPLRSTVVTYVSSLLHGPSTNVLYIHCVYTARVVRGLYGRQPYVIDCTRHAAEILDTVPRVCYNNPMVGFPAHDNQ